MQNTFSRIYIFLAALYITVLIVSNIASIKLVGIGPIIFDAGTILFPIAYILGDIITEVYGFRRMRALILTGIFMLLLTSLTFWIVGLLPAAAGWTGQSEYDTILGVVWRIVLASITALALGELANSYVLAKLKIRTAGRYLWGRIIGSTAIGSLLDTIIFSVVAFAGIIPNSTLAQLIGTVFLIKIITEIVISPLTIKAIDRIKKKENVDVFEEPSLTV